MKANKNVNAFYYYVDWRKLDSLPENTAYFHAMYRQEFPTVMGQNYLLADIEGQGHYVGTAMNIRQRTASWYGEGDDFFFIDGEEEPRLRGTGSEDYFCDAWGFRQFDGPYYGVPVFGQYRAMSNITAYRWHIADPVSFKKSLRVEIEHKGVLFNEDGSVKTGFGERSDDFASVAYWYQTEPHKAYPPLPEAYDRLYVDYRKLHQAEDLKDTAKATEGGVGIQENVGSGAGQLFWTPRTPEQSLEMSLPVEESGNYVLLLVLTQSWDYGIYQVELDGKPLGGALDLYNSSVVQREFYFETGPIEAGTHTLRFVNQGKNPKSADAADPNLGFYFGFDAYLLEKT